MTRAVMNALAGWVCLAACVALLAAGTDVPGCLRAAWFWWLKGAALAAGGLSLHLLRAAARTRR